jgi:hypothetical protein
MTSPLNRQYRPGSSSSFICEPTTITTTGFPIPANSNQPQYHFQPSRLRQYIASKQGTHASHTSSDSPPLTDSDSTRPDTPTALQIRGSEVEQRGVISTLFRPQVKPLPPRFPVSVIIGCLLLPCVGTSPMPFACSGYPTRFLSRRRCARIIAMAMLGDLLSCVRPWPGWRTVVPSGDERTAHGMYYYPVIDDSRAHVRP